MDGAGCQAQLAPWEQCWLEVLVPRKSWPRAGLMSGSNEPQPVTLSCGRLLRGLQRDLGEDVEGRVVI